MTAPRIGFFACRALGPQLVDLCLITLRPLDDDGDPAILSTPRDIEVLHHVASIPQDLRILLASRAPEGDPSPLEGACVEVCEALRGLDVIYTYGDARQAFKGVCNGLSALFLQRQPLPAPARFFDVGQAINPQSLDIHTAAEALHFSLSHHPPRPQGDPSQDLAEHGETMRRLAAAAAGDEALALHALLTAKALKAMQSAKATNTPLDFAVNPYTNGSPACIVEVLLSIPAEILGQSPFIRALVGRDNLALAAGRNTVALAPDSDTPSADASDATANAPTNSDDAPPEDSAPKKADKPKRDNAPKRGGK